MKTIVTHNGIFHADDIFAVATLLLVYPGSTVVRTRNQELITKGDIVVDVGGIYDDQSERFDHHQAGGAGERENGIPYASFGLVWKHYGRELVNDMEWNIIEEKLVMPTDALDNAFPLSSPFVSDITKYSISDFFESFILPDMDDEDFNAAFSAVTTIAKDLLVREIAKAQYTRESLEVLEQAYTEADDKRIILLDKSRPWKDMLMSKPEPLYAVYPVSNGWAAQAVPVSRAGFTTRHSFPLEWAGKTDGELARLTGVPDAIFSHRGRHLVIAKSQKGAVELVNKSLKS